MSVLVPLDESRRQVTLLTKPFGTGEIVREDPFDKDGMCYRILRHKDRRVEWYTDKGFNFKESASE